MKIELHSQFGKKDLSADNESLFYEDDHENSHHHFIRNISPLFISLFLLPAIFIYLFLREGANDNIYKVTVLLLLELSCLFIDVWIKRFFRSGNFIWIWLIEIPLMFLMFFCLYLSF